MDQKKARSAAFRPERTPLQDHEALRLVNDKVTGPFSFLNPTRAVFNHHERKSSDGEEIPEHEQAVDSVNFRWTSRNNRKGRHQLDVSAALDPATAKYLVPEATNSPREILKNIGRMFTKFPFYDVSYDVAFVFTIGSVVWVINSFFVFLPFLQPKTEFKTEVLYGGGITAFLGATIFVFGSILLMLEAVNENRTGCFGWALQDVLDNGAEKVGPKRRIVPRYESCKHHHRNRGNLVGLSAHSDASSDERDHSSSKETKRAWSWYPSMQELKSHYLHQLGFLACAFQLWGASVFWISGVTALPGIFPKLGPVALNASYWAMQIIGGSGFIVSGTLFMIEAQDRWYQPKPFDLGWHVGFWNLIGGFGFTFCPAFGIDTSSWAQYQASCSTFWGSWAFLIGSLFQLYESLQKNPVDVVKVKGGANVPKQSLTAAPEAKKEVEQEQKQNGNGDSSDNQEV